MNNLLNPLDVQFIDAPISGGQAGAELGQLSIMAGGDKQAFSKIDEVINNYAKFIKYMGKSGSGQLTKMVNQICIAGLIQALAEGINFSENVFTTKTNFIIWAWYLCMTKTNSTISTDGFNYIIIIRFILIY